MDESRITELIDALPEELKESERTSTNAYLQELLGKLEQRPIPVGRVSRAWALGTLQAKIAAAYMANWLRRGYASSGEKQRNLNETHLKAALQVLGGMSYLPTIQPRVRVDICHSEIKPSAVTFSIAFHPLQA